MTKRGRIQEVADAMFGHPYSHAPMDSTAWDGWVQRLSWLCSHQDRQMREVGEMARGKAVAERARATKQERDEAIGR